MDSANEDSANSRVKNNPKDVSFRKRLIVADIFVPLTVFFAFQGGLLFTLFVAVVLGVASWEYWRIYKQGGYSPSLILLLVFSVASPLMRHFLHFQFIEIWLGALLLLSLFIHTLQRQRKIAHAAVNLTITAFGAAYIGFLGSYAVSVRTLEHGLLWTLLVFPIIAIADAGAYIAGSLFGRHKMLVEVSPKKSWEGYIGGILIGGLGGWGLASLWHIASPAIHPYHGLILGVIISLLGPWGDFGESMIKRQFNVKDSSGLLPGHGGFFDRIDSSLWAAVIGYYLILLIR